MGYAVSTTVLCAAADQNLTTAATLRAELSLASADTSKDAWMAGAIDRISRTIANDCNRVFVPELVQDVFDIRQDAYPAQTPGGFPQLLLTRYPVIAIASVTQATSLNTNDPLTEGDDWRYDADAGQLLRLNSWTGVGTAWEALPVTVRYVSGFGSAVREQATVPASSPYTVQVSQSAAFACDQAVTLDDGTVLTRVNGAPAAGQYSVAVATGTYTFNVAQADQAITIDYATRAIPGDLEDVCLRLLVQRFHNMGRDPSLIQRDTPGVGTERWWYGSAPGQKGPFPPDIDAMLENYRMPVVA